VVGYGPVELVAAEWNRGGERAGHVELHERRAVRPSKKSRTYFANTCSEGVYNNTDYVALKLLGKTLRYTTDVSGAGCGCNAGLYLTALSQNTVKSDCFDYYCDANSVCGVACNELDLQEANQHAWHSTLKTQDDGIGVKCGLGGNSGILDKCNWAPEDYGRGGRCIDTSKPFQVAVSFHVNDIGRFKAMEVRLSQDGGRCHLSATLEEYTHHGRDGMAELSAALARGMTPTISYWASDDMMWMDGLDSRGKGHCIRDNAAACPESVRFYDFAIEEISGEKPPCEEQCPVGHCDRGSDGTCKWFSGKYLSKYKSYHCKVANCSDVPASSSMSKCWSWEGQAYYSIKHRHYPCPERHGNLSLASGVIPVEQQVSGEPGRPELEADVAAKRVRSAVQEEILAIAHILMRWTRRPHIAGRGVAPPATTLATVASVATAAALVAAVALAVLSCRRVGLCHRDRTGNNSHWQLAAVDESFCTLVEPEAARPSRPALALAPAAEQPGAV